jgi:transcription antitermination protein NusB
MTQSDRRRRGRPTGPRRTARLLAVQALYQIAFTGAPVGKVLLEFHLRLPGEEGAPGEPPDWDLMSAVVEGAWQDRERLDGLVAEQLTRGRGIERLPLTLQAILRAGCYELSARADVPARVVINEYMDVTHAFFTGGESALVNGVLDGLARRLRPEEFGGRPPPGQGTAGR